LLATNQYTRPIPPLIECLHVGYHGSEIRTPNIDALAHEGVRLHRYYAFPLCSPTRAAFLTGRSPIRLGVDTPIGPRGALPLSEHLLSETLGAAGYQTFLVGKWHLGIDRIAAHPYRRGFDQSYGHLGASIDYFTHVWINSLDWHRNGVALQEEGYSTDLIAAEAVRLIEGRDPSRPFFLYLSFNAPHAPLQAPEEQIRRHPGIRSPQRQVYAAMVSAMDDGIGRVLAALSDEGIERDTLLVWASDNGGGRNQGASNRPLRGAKGSAFEGGIRVPAVVHWPGVLNGGERFEQIFTAMDWFPTLTTALGVRPENPRPLDGLDLWGALREARTTVERRSTVIGVDGSYAVFQGPWKLVQFTPRGARDTQTLLFRILEDPEESQDLAQAHPEIVDELLAELRAVPRGPSVSSRRPPGPRRGRSAGNEPAPALLAPWVERAAKD
ncbi:MAG: arylsulfatase, partial [Bryobacterales bacterium]|nr:arylsulfatase [Bryobacterales bacterium]